jgi:hypothetical protein
MARKGVFPAIQGDDGWIITPSDTINVKDDPNNPGDYEFVFLHNPSITDAISVRVLPAAAPDDDDRAIDVGIAATGTCPIAVKRIYATDPVVAEGDLTAFVSGQRM